MKYFNYQNKSIFLFFLLFVLAGFSQGPIKLGWSGSVGCQTFGQDPRLKELALSDIQEDVCLNVCESTSTIFTLTGAGLGANPTTTWTVGGGVIGGQNNTTCTVNWSGAGVASLSFTIVTSTGVTIVKTLCVKKQKAPGSKFTIAPYNIISDPDILNVCIGQTVNFVNLSLSGNEIVSYDSLWDFGNGVTSTVQNPSYQYMDNGIYEVRLEITNSCGCKTVFGRRINVSNRGFDINTPSTVCEGQIETYSVGQNQCVLTPTLWSVVGGKKVSETATSVTVLWNNPAFNAAQGLYPLQQGIGSVTYSPSTCNIECTTPTTIRIPVVKLTEPIVGLTSICTGQQVSYKLPQWPTTDFRWKVLHNGLVNPSTVQLLVGIDRNEVFIRPLASVPGTPGFPGGPITLVCNYTNTLLHCGGSSSLTINVGNTVPVQGPTRICRNTPVIYTATSPVNWVIKNSTNTTVATQTNATSINFTTATAGVYTLTTSGTNICSQTLQITVITAPAAPSISTVVVPSNPFLSVFTNVCPNTQYNYKILNPAPGAEYIWSLGSGIFIAGNTGNEVAVKFNASTSNSISVYQKFNAPLCNSLTATKPVQMVVINEANAAIVSTLSVPNYSVCGSSTSSYKTPFLGADTYTWAIDPPSLGSIATGQGTNQITVNWNNASNPQGSIANIKLTLSKCSVGYVANPRAISILNRPSISIVGASTPVSICSGSPVTFSLQQPNQYLTPTTQITWTTSEGYSETTAPGIFSFTTNFLTTDAVAISTTITASLTITAGNGCTGTYTSFPANVNVTPGPIAFALSFTGSNTYCSTSSPPTQITATLTASSPTAGVTFQWYKNNVLLSGNGLTSSTAVLTTTQILAFGDGSYRVRISKNGCTSISNPIGIGPYCPPQIVCDLPGPALFPTITSSYTCSADSLTPSVTVTGTPSHLQTSPPTSTTVRVFGPGIGIQGANPLTFTPPFAGYYNVSYTATYTTSAGSCSFPVLSTIAVPYLPNFTLAVNCISGAATTISLADNSNFIGAILPADRSFKFYYSINNGATYTLLSSTQTAQITLTNNNYLFKLVVQGTLNGVLQPACEKILPFANPNPVQAIIATTLNTNNSAACNDSIINFNVSNPQQGDTYLWNFGDDSASGIPSTNNNQSIDKVFGNINTSHPVTLIITNPYGCSRTLNLNIFVPNNCFNGTVTSITGNAQGTPTPQTCKGSTIDIRYKTYTTEPNQLPDNCPTSGVTFTLMNGSTAVTTNTTGIFTVTSQGFYWLKLSKAGAVNGSSCVYETTSRVIPTFLPLPIVSLSSPGSVCGNTASIGITTNLLGTGTALSYALDGGVSIPLVAATSASIELTGLTLGTHNVVVTAVQNGCTVQQTTYVTVVAPPAQVTIASPVYTCAPSFSAQLTASATGTGTYQWSNGASGSSITVNQGGPYSVSFIGEGGCSTSAQTDVAAPPQEYLWAFPSGNYFVCKDATQKIIGPNGVFNVWKWLKNNVISESGVNSLVAPYPSVSGSVGSGLYNLSLTNGTGGCAAVSLPMNLTVGGSPCNQCLSINTTNPLPNFNPIAATPTAPFCAYQVTIPLTALPNLVAGSVVQATPQENLAVVGPVTTTATSISFKVFPLNPFPTSGGIMPIQFTGTLSNTAAGVAALGANARKCLTKVNINLNPCGAGVPVYRTATTTKNDFEADYLVVAPNPAKNQVTISYATNELATLSIYDLTGRFIAKHEAAATRASWDYNSSSLPAGIYLVVLQEKGQFMLQKKLVIE